MTGREVMVGVTAVSICDCLQCRPDILLIEPEGGEAAELRLNTDLEQILGDEQWIDDATGLVPHCIALLKVCHELTERLAGLAMAPLHSTHTTHQIGEIARKISGRVDDVVRSMYPPLDPRLLEARAAALTLAVTHLALVTRYECGRGLTARPLHFIDRALGQMDAHLLVGPRTLRAPSAFTLYSLLFAGPEGGGPVAGGHGQHTEYYLFHHLSAVMLRLSLRSANTPN